MSEIDLKAGQVYFNQYFFKCIREIKGQEVLFFFYNRTEYYYPPNQRRKTIEPDYVGPIETWQLISEFISEVKKKKLKIAENYFEVLPVLGMPMYMQSYKKS